jgi:hypothetical protein
MTGTIWSRWIRQAHRWLSITFVAFVVANIALMGQGDIALWIGFATLLPLVLLMLSGLYMFASPYIGRWRAARQAKG